MVFIQESKLEIVTLRTFHSLGGNGSISGEFTSSVGAAGGLITMWDDNFFTVESKLVAQRFILLVGVIKLQTFKCGFGNIYAPNDDRERQVFWNELGTVINNIEIPWCLGVILIQ